MRQRLAIRSLGVGVAVLVVTLVAACAPRPAMMTTSVPAGESYDPPGSTITTGRAITLQERRTITDPESGVSISNDFPAARLDGFERTGPGTFRLLFRPENAPINKSAWYAFKIQAPTPRRVTLELTYEDGEHRYVPKLSRDGVSWTVVDTTAYHHDVEAKTARLTLDVGPDPLIVAGQEMTPSSWFDDWTGSMVELAGAERRDVGVSLHGRPIGMVSFGNTENPAGVVLVIGRQHPPEVTGTLALVKFVETLLADDSLAAAFRAQYRTVLIPLMNPDGVDEGHWRHNAGGVDLNRDWLHFNQPEVRVVRDAFLAEVERYGAPVVFAADFHSTQEDIFYTHTPDFDTNRGDLIDRWLQAISAAVPEYEVLEEAGGLESPVSKNWFYTAFHAPSVIYEVGDEQDRALIDRVAVESARAMMRLVLDGK